jgi:cell wall-associated NlpC family hydrolase
LKEKFPLLLKKLFPYALAACFALGMFPLSAAAQSGEARQRQVAHTTETYDLSALDNDPVIVSLASAEDIKASQPVTAKTTGGLQFRQLITAAIDERLGARYSWGATGPSAFDCSGFVWSTFQSAGIGFERGSARTLWARFTAPAPEEQYKFGTLVFFSNLAHVGIVADEHGFYHASRHHGVVYAPFNDYWLSRIDGFRRVPISAPLTTD